MKNLEKELLELQNEKLDIPSSVLNKIDLAFNEIRNDNKVEIKNKSVRKNNGIKKKYMSIAAVLAIVALIGVSSPVRAAIEQLMFSFKNPGIESAVENNYVQSISNEKIVEKDFTMELNNVLIDPSHIALDFKIKLNDELAKIIKEDKYQDIYVDVSIYNENNNVIEKDGVKGFIGGIDDNIDKSEINNNILKYNMLLTSNTAEIPIPKKLKINIERLRINSNTQNPEKTILDSKLKWNIVVDLDEKFIKENIINYTFENTCPNIIVKEAKAIPTGMYVNFEYLDTRHQENILNNIKLVDENGKSYGVSGCRIENGENGGDLIYTVFNGLTSFDKPSKFTLEVQNPDGVTIDKVDFKTKQ